MPTEPNMLLVLPTEDASDDVWDVLLNAALTRVGGHNHTPGFGVKVPSAGIDINADLPVASGGTPYALTDAKTLTLTPIDVADMATYACGLFVNAANSELYFHDSNGDDVQVTLNGSLNVASLAGGIGGDYAAVGALLSYDDASDRYLAQQQGAPRPWAGFAMGRLDLYEQAASVVNRVRLRSPDALAASYEVVLPAGTPSVAGFLQMSTAGALSVSNALPADESITLSGTGTYKHGDKILSRTIHQGRLIAVDTGTVSTTPGTPGAVQSASGSAWYAIDDLPADARMKSVKVYATGGANTTCSLWYSDTSTFFAHAGASGSPSGAPGSVTLTPSGGPASNPGLTLKVVTGGVGTSTISRIEIAYDVA